VAENGPVGNLVRAQVAGGDPGIVREAQQPAKSDVLLLSSRQRQIAELVTRGMTSSEIAAQLSLSRRTVDNHLAVIFRKLGVKGRVELTSMMTAGTAVLPSDPGYVEHGLQHAASTPSLAAYALDALVVAALAPEGDVTPSRMSQEERAVRNAVSAAFASALADAAREEGKQPDENWLGIAYILRSAFTQDVATELVACLSDTSGSSRGHFAERARAALAAEGCDFAVFDRAIRLEQFLAVLPQRLSAELSAAALGDPRVRGLVGQLLAHRTEAQADRSQTGSGGQFRSDLIAMLSDLGRRARAGRLPAYFPPGADAIAVTRMIRVREGLRGRRRPWSVDDDMTPYRLAAIRSEDDEPARPWSEVMAQHKRLVVLGDPGLGKTWLIRSETYRLCLEALAGLDGDDTDKVHIPVSLRCDELDAAPGTSLAAKAAAHLAGQGLLAQRSQPRLASKIAAGQVVLLLDAADELTSEAAGRVGELLRSWAQEVGDHARCVVTSRIAGYRGSPVPGAIEVELQAMTAGDVAAVISAWGLPPMAVSWLHRRISDPAIGSLARIPLLLALLCSLASRHGGQALPASRGQLYERVLRWFLTGAHRSLDSPATPARDDIAIDMVMEILSPLAFTFASAPGGWTDLLTSEQVLTAIRTAGPAFTEMGRPAGEVLRELSVADGILVPDSDPSAGRSPRYLFAHRTFAEYLVARHLATLPTEDWLAVVEQHRWFDPEWAQVFPMLGERLAPPCVITLIRHFLDGQADPFYHSLLTAARIWGARPDADHLLPGEMVEDLARRITGLLSNPLRSVRSAASAELAAMAYLPRPLLTPIMDRLADHRAAVRAAAVKALAGRGTPEVTAALLDRLADQDDTVRAAAVKALAGRGTPEVTAALLDRLGHDDTVVQAAAAHALSEAESPSALLLAASEIHTLPRSCWLILAEVTEQLMLRHYLRLEPAKRAAVRVAISELAGTKAA
jgi:DNA-binding CsgD family transcriptional regulator